MRIGLLKFCTAWSPQYILRTATPILDSAGRVIGVCAGCPNDTTWEGLQRDAAAAMEAALGQCDFSGEEVDHRRGQFPALAVGASFGGGQRVVWLGALPMIYINCLLHSRFRETWLIMPSTRLFYIRYLAISRS